MSRKLQVVIDKNGKIVESFSGFKGGTCYEEAQKLRDNLRELGVELELEPGTIKPVATPIPETECEGEAPQKELEGS